MTTRNLFLLTAVVVGGCQAKPTESVRDGMLASLRKERSRTDPDSASVGVGTEAI